MRSLSERLSVIQKELADMREQFNAMKARWENEKNSIGKVQKLREEIEHMDGEIDEAERNYDLNRAAELKYGKLPQLQKELAEAGEDRRGSQERQHAAARQGDRGRNRPYRRPLDGHPGCQADGRRARKAAASG